MALSVDTAARDAVGYRIFGRAYSGLDTTYQGSIDSALGGALTIVQSEAKYYGLASAAPDEWSEWFHSEGALRCAHAHLRDAVNDLQQERDVAREMALATLDSTANTDANTAGTFTLEQVRVTIRRRLRAAGVRVANEIADRSFEWSLSHVWNYSHWHWRRDDVVLTIATDSTVTVSPAIDIGAFNTTRLYFTDTDGIGLEIRYAAPDEMQRHLALGSNAARPRMFGLQRAGDDLVFQFYPTPDKSYTARAEVVLRGPPAVTSATATTPFDAIPEWARPLILDLTAAKVASDLMVRGSDAKLEMVQENVRDGLVRMGKLGAPTQEDSTPGDAYGDVHQFYPSVNSVDMGYNW